MGKLPITTKKIVPVKVKQSQETSASGPKNDPDYKGELSPFRSQITASSMNSGGLDYDGRRARNLFTLNDYVWYPEDSRRWFNKDYSVTTIKTDIIDNNIGLFGNMSVSRLKSSITGDDGKFSIKAASNSIGSIINKSWDYAKSQLEGVHDSITGKNDKSEDATEIANANYFDSYITQSIPKIIISEFQPNNEITEAVAKLTSVFETASNFFKGGSGQLQQMFSEEGREFFLSQLIGTDWNKFKDQQQAERNVISIPNWFYTHMISGYFTAKYEIPYLNQDNYLMGQGSEGWSSRTLKSKMLGPLSKLADGMSDAAAAFDIAAKPKWNIDGSGPVYEAMTCEVTLFNYDVASLYKNFSLIHNIVPGNMWMQSVLLQKSSALYDIEIPGRMRYYLCKGDISVEFVGKQRRAPEAFKDLLREHNKTGKTINMDAVYNVPDAYKLTMTFTPLLPNNFNLYMNYFMKDVNDGIGNDVGKVRHDMESATLKAVAKTQEWAVESAAKAKGIKK